MSLILELMKENNEEVKRKFPRGKRVVVSTSKIQGEGVVIDMWEARSIEIEKANIENRTYSARRR